MRSNPFISFFLQDEAEQSLRLQETFFREFTLIDGKKMLAVISKVQFSSTVMQVAISMIQALLYRTTCRYAE
jgi:hypothetical protein